MILSKDVAQVIFDLRRWAASNHVAHEADEILSWAVYYTVQAQLDGTLGNNVAGAFVRHVLQGADARGYARQAETALTECGYGEHVPPKWGLFDVSFAGITLRLTLPLNRAGQPVGVHGAVDRAMEDATITPVTADAGDVLPESSIEVGTIPAE